jgi:coproporphyrinogen III oxidase
MNRIPRLFQSRRAILVSSITTVALTTTVFADAKKDVVLHTEKSAIPDYEKQFTTVESKLLTVKEQRRRVEVDEVYRSGVAMSQKMETLVTDVQARMTSLLSLIDGKEFYFDRWTRKQGGFGCSAVLQNGNVFEKAGVNVSIIKSSAPPAMLKQMRARKSMDIDESKEYDMFVAGVSMVVHPWNPKAPTFHANYRYFELVEKGQSEPSASWFGGGCDLTPSYLFEEDAKWFHKVIKDVSDRHDVGYYPKFKKWCDEYFHNTHRGERRGVGGIFFDDLESGEKTSEQLFSFVKEAALVLTKQYIPILINRKDLPFTQEEKEWQQLRRGRYVEFNLVF